MKKRFLTALLILITVTCLALGLSACVNRINREEKPEYSEGLEFTLLEDGESYALTGLGNCAKREIVIPPTYDGLPVTRIGRYANLTNAEVNAMTNDEVSALYIFMDGIMESGYPYSHVEEVIIPDGVKEIGFGAFYWCRTLSSVTIPDSVTSIGNYAFYHCEYLPEITISDGVTCIGDRAFSNCTQLKSVSFGKSVNNIGIRAFENCRNLENITLPDGFSVLSSNAFSACTSLKSATFGSGDITIGANAFHNCLDLTEVTFSAGVTSIGGYAFYGCSGIKDLTLPDGLTSIDDYAFSKCSGLKKLTLPDSLTTIGNYTFLDCYGIEELILPDSLITIENGAFGNCTSLLTVYLGKGLQSFGNLEGATCSSGAFGGCCKLVEVCNATGFDIVAGNSDFGEVALYAKNVYTPTSGASKLVCTDDGYVFYKDDEANYLVDYKGEQSALTLPNGFDGKPYCIYEYAFYKNDVIESVTAYSGITSIGMDAFEYCTNLKSVSFGHGLIEIAKYAFYSCSNLTDITIPYTVKKIGESAFYGTAFYNDDKNWQDGVLYIGKHLIKANRTVSGEYVVKDGTVMICVYAFNYCKELTSITIPSSVKTIGEYAFSMCDKLGDFTFKGTIDQWSAIINEYWGICRVLTIDCTDGEIEMFL